MLLAKAFPRVEESPSILDADVTFTLPQHPLVLMEALSLWEDIRPLLDPPASVGSMCGRHMGTWSTPRPLGSFSISARSVGRKGRS
jgi:hypothetical protein